MLLVDVTAFIKKIFARPQFLGTFENHNFVCAAALTFHFSTSDFGQDAVESQGFCQTVGGAQIPTFSLLSRERDRDMVQGKTARGGK